MKIDIVKRMSFTDSVFSAPQGNGSIHSVYNKTINIKWGSQLLALQASSSPLSPVSLLLSIHAEDMEKLGLFSGMPVHMEGHTFIIPSAQEQIIIDFSNSSVEDSQLFPASTMDFQALLAPALFASHKNGFKQLFTDTDEELERDNSYLILQAAKNRIDRTAELFQKKDYTGAALELARLIGLGIGLTPSGDDFLCGVFAAFILMHQATHPFITELKARVSERLSDTNEISRTFLSCALSGHFSQLTTSLPKLSTIDEILFAFEQIGHSSGMDTLSGIYYVSQLLFSN